MRQPAGMRSAIRCLSLVLALGLLQACSGDDGSAGPEGPPGPLPPGVTAEARSLTVSFDSVETESTPQIEFSVSNESGIPYVGLQASNVRFTLAKLLPGSDGDPDRWQSYINRLETAGAVGPGTQDQIQATADRGSSFSNHGNGRYSFSFATDVSQVTEPLAVSYQPELSHRLALQISGGEVPVTNAVYDWRPADGAREGIARRDIVDTATCNRCHGGLALHGGGRIETRYCVTCHNPGSTDANSGNILDFTSLVHKIHRGADLPSVRAGGEYVIWGFRNSRHDYSDLVLPQDIRNCVVCHDGANPATPQGDNWMQRPSVQACGACHDDVDFASGTNHGPAEVAASNSECAICHSEGGLAGSVAAAHAIPARLAGERYRFNILDISGTAPGEFPTVRFSVTDPDNDDAPQNLLEDPAWTNLANRASRLAVIIGWNTTDYHNRGSGRSPAQPISIDALRDATANGDGSYSVTSPTAIPPELSGSGVIGLDGHPAADFDGDGEYSDRVPVTNAVESFAITDGDAVDRRTVVDIARCNDCHAQLSLHGNNRTDEPQLCVICHNPDATDLNRRPADASSSPDGLAERPIDFKHMIHGIHAAHVRETPFVVYGFGGRAHDFSHVAYPRSPADCVACHSSGSYTLPLPAGVLATTVDTGADKSSPDDDLNISPTAAVCSACHDGELAATHMEQNGASFATTQGLIDNGSVTETCAICHGPGRVADVESVHAR